MATRFDLDLVARRERIALAAILLLALAARAVALLVLDRAPTSDGASYYLMAVTAFDGTGMRDIYGNAALYSPGYPLLLGLVFKLFGASVAAARALNVALGLAMVALTWGIARRAGGPLAGLIAAFGSAVLIPTIGNIDLLEREHLATPLLLLFVLAAMHVPTARRPRLVGLIAGLAFGYGLLAGVSSLFAGSALLVAGWQLHRAGRPVVPPLAVAALAAGLVLAPWMARNAMVLGTPVMSSNGGINLYVGNNPTATGGYVSPSDTPAGRDWQATRARLGELGHDALLKREAITWATTHPVRAALLDAKKLLLFWAPDLPDAGDEDHGGAVTAVRWAGALQHVLIVALALVAATAWRRWRPGLWVVAAALVGFWAIHGLVYVMARYRTPALPLAVVIAAMPVAQWIGRRRAVPATGVVAMA